MFNKQNFCHVASNNRNDVKVGVFVYKTTDDLETVSTSGYFNEKIIDINLHDIIIHEWHDPADRTKVEKNILCVTERTLDNVGTTVIKSKWEEETDQAIEDIEETIESLDNTYLKLDGTNNMTGPLNLKNTANDKVCSIEKYMNNGIKLSCSDYSPAVILSFTGLTTSICPSASGYGDLGAPNLPWGTIFVDKIRSSGANILVPSVNTQDTMALKSQVDDAANSGEQLYTTGVWYAKMYSATTIPAEAEVEGRNYADFSQVDGNNDPIIVVYTYTSGAWATTATITPPKNHNGYMTITSKIWDIQEQAGQQGGLVLWSHNQGTFTPYPRIVSFDSANITNSTIAGSTIDQSTLTDCLAPLPTTIVNNTIANVGYVKESQNKQGISDLATDTATVVLSKDKTIYRMSVSTDLAITIDASAVAEEGYAQTFELHLTSGATTPTITWTGIDRWVINSETSPVEVNATSIFAIRVQMGENESTPTVVANYGGAY